MRKKTDYKPREKYRKWFDFKYFFIKENTKLLFRDYFHPVKQMTRKQIVFGKILKIKEKKNNWRLLIEKEIM